MQSACPRLPVPEKKYFKLIIAYDGADYAGFQDQKVTSKSTVQGVINEKLRAYFVSISREPTSQVRDAPVKAEEGTRCADVFVSTCGASRTDAGVHAREQTLRVSVSWPCDRDKDTPTFSLPALDVLSALLPAAIRCRSIESSFKSFRPGEGVTSKEYRYFFSMMLPIKHAQPGGTSRGRNSSRFIANVPYELNFSAIQKCLDLLTGTHDFVNFCSAGSNVATTRRTVYECDLQRVDSLSAALNLETCEACSELFCEEKKEDDLPTLPKEVFQVRVVGDGFLKQMVRHILGSLWAVGRGKLSTDEWGELLSGSERRNSHQLWKAAPAKGLFLYKINYGQ